jgi:uncharacterized protein YjiK
MTWCRRVVAAGLIGAAPVACGPPERRHEPPAAEEVAARKARTDSAIEEVRNSGGAAVEPGRPLARWVMPAALAEISGLAQTSDGRLLAHDDEKGIISEIDYRSGRIVKSFQVGNRLLRGDFEGIATVSRRIFLATSTGRLYEMAEGREGEQVPYRLHETDLGRHCELEGLAHDAARRVLLLACKNVDGKANREELVIYRWPLSDGNANRMTTVRVERKEIERVAGLKDFHVSSIDVDPKSGNYVMVAGPEIAWLEITPAGAVVRGGHLPKGLHQQPEGVVLTEDGTIIISDEGRRQPATITLYAYPLP